jgi:hypothetical protein
VTGDPIGDALRADADAAREEIRTMGLVCPSCGGNAADLLGRHCLILISGSGQPEAECRDGQRITVDTYDKVVGAMNVAVLDEWWWREGLAFDRLLGIPPR